MGCISPSQCVNIFSVEIVLKNIAITLKDLASVFCSHVLVLTSHDRMVSPEAPGVTGPTTPPRRCADSPQAGTCPYNSHQCLNLLQPTG